MEPGNYAGMIIRKSITVTGAPGAAIVRNVTGDSITINAGASDVVSITGLIVNGMNVVARGLRVNSAGQVNIKDCVFKNHVGDAITFPTTVPVTFALDDTLFAGNNVSGIRFQPANGGSVKGALHRVTITGGGAGSFGVIMVSRSELRISESLISNHGQNGVYVGPDSTNMIWLSGNTITRPASARIPSPASCRRRNRPVIISSPAMCA